LAGETDRAKWFEFGLFWALIALTNASLLSFLPVSVGWLGWHLRRQEVGRGIPIAVLTIAFVVGISPWVIRNYLVFGSLVPLRSDLGEELFAGNHEGGNGLYYEVKRWNLSELQRVGELRFVAERRQMALHFITNHPGDFAIFVAKRIGYFWCDLPRGWHVPHFGTGTRQVLHFTFALTSFWVFGRRTGVKEKVLFSSLSCSRFTRWFITSLMFSRVFSTPSRRKC